MNRKVLKNSRWIMLVSMMVLMLSVSGCSFSENMFTDTGTNVVIEADTGQYLNLSLLDEENKSDEGKTWNGYKIHTLEHGTFSTNIIATRANISMVETNQVKAQFHTGSMILKELLVSKNSYLEKGDVIARVAMETSELDLEEQELKLQRLEEEYAQAVADYNQKHEDAVANISVYHHPGNIDRIEIAQMELDFERTKTNYEARIAEKKEQIREMRELASTKEILAPQSGFVLSVSRLEAGQEIQNGTVICSMAPTDKIVLAFEDETQYYGYGMDLTLTMGRQQMGKSYDVQVVNALGKSLVENWGESSARIMGDYDMAEIIGNGPFIVSGQTKVMENVLLVPKDAVEEENSKYYVTVLHEDETLEKRQFVLGGYNAQYYWVFDGLEAGTKIIVEN